MVQRSNYENGVVHGLQLPARGNATAFGANNAVHTRHADKRLLPAHLHNALLCGKVIA
jgi:hypothetical protein